MSKGVSKNNATMPLTRQMSNSKRHVIKKQVNKKGVNK
jgi:hypothetical protein